MRNELLGWYERNKRDLPWRHTNDSYAIWVSEIMLQQTRVAVVIERYTAFLERFPTVNALAAAGRAGRPRALERPRLLPPRPHVA